MPQNEGVPQFMTPKDFFKNIGSATAYGALNTYRLIRWRTQGPQGWLLRTPAGISGNQKDIEDGNIEIAEVSMGK